MSKATVYDYTPSQLLRALEEHAPARECSASCNVVADMADGIEAAYQLMSLAGFTERPRAFVLTLASAAFTMSSDCIELFDDELAELQNCSTKTVQRQRRDYLRESKARHFIPVEVLDGEFNQQKGKNDPTRYRLLVREHVERCVRGARDTNGWNEMSRRTQRQQIKRVAQEVYVTIPNTSLKRRKQRRARTAVAEIETCLKVIETKLKSLKNKATKLPARERERLMSADEPGKLILWWLPVRADVDTFLNLNSRQPSEWEEVSERGRQLVRALPLGPEKHSDPDPDSTAAWRQIEDRLTSPQIRTVDVPLYRADLGSAVKDVKQSESEVSMEFDGGLGGSSDD
ncbi:MAG: hypothetical protein ACJ741_09095 [Pyrinomonadaceae bacterium]